MKPQPLLSDEEIEEMLELSRESMDAHKLARSLAKACAQAKLAALPRSEPKVDVCSVCHREVGAGQHVCFDPSPIAALPRSEPKEAGDESYIGDTITHHVPHGKAAPAKSAPIFDPKWIQAAIDDRLPEGCVGIGQPDGTFKVMHLETQKEVGTLPPRPKSAPDAVAQVLASSLGATESRWGEAKGNAEGTAPVKTDAEGGWLDISTAPKDGSAMLVTGWNYGKPDGVRHYAVARWSNSGEAFIEDSEWNAPSELHFLTHWQPRPQPPALGDL